MRFLIHFVVVTTCILGRYPLAHAQSVSFAEQRPFVVGVVPVVGNGTVGGVAIDANGAIEQAEQRDVVALRNARRVALEGLAEDITKRSELRKVSLRRLEMLLARTREPEQTAALGGALPRGFAAHRVCVRLS